LEEDWGGCAAEIHRDAPVAGLVAGLVSVFLRSVAIRAMPFQAFIDCTIAMVEWLNQAPGSFWNSRSEARWCR